MPENSTLKLSRDHQRLVIAGLLQNGYILSAASKDINDSYFTDSSCRIIYKSLSGYYEEFSKLPSEAELSLLLESNYIEIGDSLETVKDNLHQLYAYDKIDEEFLLERVTELIKKVRVSRALQRNLEKIKNGTALNDNRILNDLINSLDVSYSRSGILCLSDNDGLLEARKEAVGNNSNEVIRSILPSINQSLQYRGFQKGTMNLIVSPPGCFTGDTKIMTLDGKSHSLENLYNFHGEIGIYGCSPDGKINTGIADRVYLSEYTDDLVEVELDNGFKIRCTPDHPFMMREGDYKHAESLEEGDSLMPIHHGLNHSEFVKEAKASNHKVKSVRRLKLEKKVPVYGVVNAGTYHNYALDIGEGEGIFVSNTGKTSYLVNEGAYAALQGFNTLHVFLGDMIQYDGFVRYISCISGELQDNIIDMSAEEQQELVEKVNEDFNDTLRRISVLSYGSGEIAVDQLIENINKEQERLGVVFDDIIIDYADNFLKDNTALYSEGGYIYDRLALYGRVNHSVIMVASQPKIQYWRDEVIPLEGASESSKKQHIVDLLMTFNLVNRNAKIGTFFVPKVRRGISGKLIRVKTEWERCRIVEISEQDYTNLKSEMSL